MLSSGTSLIDLEWPPTHISVIICLTLRTVDVLSNRINYDVHTYRTLIVVWLDISILKCFLLSQRVFIIHFTVLFVIAFSAFHSIRSRIFYPIYTPVPRFPVSHFPPLHFWRCRFFGSRIFSRPIQTGTTRKLGCGFLVTMAVSVTVYELFSVKVWRDLENCVRGCSMSLEMTPFDRPRTTFYWSAIVNAL